MKQRTIVLGILLVGAAGLAGASAPPEMLNYQGVLRDASDTPLEGSHEMVFRFYDAEGDGSCVGGTLLLTDAHETAGTGAVQVTGGLFNVQVGTGSLTPGAAADLGAVFRDYQPVYLELEIGGESLCPRVRVLSAGYALNAAHIAGYEAGHGTGQIPVSDGTKNTDLNADLLDGLTSSSFGRRSSSNTWSGQNSFTNPANTFAGDGSGLTGVTATNADLLDGLDSAHFLNTTPSAQTKLGTLSVDVTGGGVIPAVSATSDFYGVDAVGNSAGGYFRDGNQSGYAYVGSGDVGVSGYGNGAGASFRDLDSSGEAYVAWGDRGIEASGTDAGGYFWDRNQVGYSYVGYTGKGIEAHGSDMGGLFIDDDGSGQANLASGDTGIVAYGNLQAGYFDESDGSGKALIAYNETGIEAEGSTAGGRFLHTGGSTETYLATASYGIDAVGTTAAGRFARASGSSEASVATDSFGVDAVGVVSGGHFTDSLGHASAHVAGNGGYGIDVVGDPTGVRAIGATTGGTFLRSDGTSEASLADGAWGITAEGVSGGGYFDDSNDEARAWIATSGTGINAQGTLAGYFRHHDYASEVWLAEGSVGIQSTGTLAGRFDQTGGSSWAQLGYNSAGIVGKGQWLGGIFEDLNGTGIAWVGHHDDGIEAHGNESGGFFKDRDDLTAWARVAQYYSGTPYKIRGSGLVSFVQNHPERPDQVIVYAAPEGDEAATYTRGTARLVAGEARVQLGETFRWVTNPDVGLTVYLTPVGRWSDLYVVSKSTEEIVVRSWSGADDVLFDYVVFGLRLGFEQAAPVQDKRDYAPVPDLGATDAYYAAHPGLRRFNALERFGAMRDEIGIEDGPLDLGRARTLIESINRFDEETDGPFVRTPEERRAAATTDAAASDVSTTDPAIVGANPVSKCPESPAASGVLAGVPVTDAEGNVLARSFRASATDLAQRHAVSEPVSRGDVLVVDPRQPGLLRPGRAAGDPTVVGIVAGEPGVLLGDGEAVARIHAPDASEPAKTTDRDVGMSSADEASSPASQAPIAVAGTVVLCKVDAGYGSLRPGDLLMTSPTPGHAMRADDPLPGTVLGKVMETLDTGTGLIRVLVMFR